MGDMGDGESRARVTVTRRTLLRGVAADRAAAAKFTQKAVFYRPHPSLGQKCSNCLLFERPHACRSVTGTISPNGWCVIWRDG